MFTKIFVFILALSSSLVYTAEAPQAKKTQIIDANHFYSEQNKQKTYKITQLQKGKALAIVIKPSSQNSYTNKLKLTIKSGQNKKQCDFNTYQDLCVLEKVETTQGTLDIKCQKLPCDVTWKIYQPQIKNLQNAQKISGLYKIPTDTHRLMIQLVCKTITTTNQQQVAQQTSLAIPFSNVPFEMMKVSNTNQYITYQQIKQGYLFFIVNPKYKSCANMKVIKGVKNIGKQLISDFMKLNKKNVYQIDQVPKNKDFRFDISFHHPFSIGLDHDATISITAMKNNQRVTLRKNKIQFNPSYRNYDLSYVVPKINTQQYKNIQLQFDTTTNLILVQTIKQQSQKIQVQATEFSYFSLKKGQKLSYKLVPQPQAQKTDILNITPSNQKSISVSKKKCSMKQGCQFEVQAVQDIEGHIYIGIGTGIAKQAAILDFGQKLSFTHKIKQYQNVYIKKQFELKKPIQITINSPNVILYLSNTKLCQVPSQNCYQHIGNINHHFIYYPTKQQQKQGIFLIKALDTCQFTLTLIPQNSQYIQLKDSQPFVYMFDKQQKQLKFKFIREEKKDINFNLISSLHALDLIVVNGKKLPQDDQAIISAEGYLQFKVQDAPKKQFTILIRKRQGFQDKFVHFTIIASSKGKQIRLETGITHYQTLPALQKKQKNNAQYIFQFDPREDYALNFYTHNTKQQKINIKLKLSALVQTEVKQTKQSSQKNKKQAKLIIDKSSDVLNLNEISQQLCQKTQNIQNNNCEILMQLQNTMDKQIDTAITLLTHHTILQLKDGIWQSYSLNSIAKSTHFYFIPRNKNHDVSILYKTTDPAIRLKYRIFYMTQNEIDPSQWPFPSQQISQQQKNEQNKYKPINHINIGKSTLQQCWPYCTILISIIDLQHKDNIGSYSIMSSNSIVQLPQKQKIDITLTASQTKSFLVDLKYALSIQQNIFFYIYHSIGLTTIYANVYSQKNDRIPQQDNFDFPLNSQQQIKIPISAIKDIIKRQQMQQNINIYLYIIIQAITDAKLSIQFTFNQINQPNQKLISLDTFQHIMLTQNEYKIYYTPINQQYEIKISRQNGFPFYLGEICKKQLQQCLKQIHTKKQKGQQILTKIAAYTAQPCQNCYYIFKISTQDDPSQINLHLQSKISQIQMIQNKPIYDFTQKGQSNKYILYAIRGQQININIHISQGQVDVSITDLHNIKQNKSGKKILSFKIPSQSTSMSVLKSAKQNIQSSMKQFNKNQQKQLTKQQKQKLQKQQKSMQQISILKKSNPILTQALMSAFGLSDKFIQLHIQVKSIDPQKPTIYTISYSSGDLQFQLQDGLITDYILQPSKQTTFYYSSRNAGHVYFTLSMQKSIYLKDLQIVMKYCQPKNNIIDDQCWVEYKIDKPPIKDKTPHPTLMYSLIDKNYLAISLTHKGKQKQKVSLGINHQQIMILPYNVQFPFILHGQQKLSLLVQLSNAGYIEIVTRKCDQSNPIFSYTFDYQSFQKDQFTYQTQLTSITPKNRYITKIKPGTLYMRFKGMQKQQSMISIIVNYSQSKIKDNQIFAGNKGNVQYSIIDSANGELTIKPPICSQKCDSGKYKYYLMSANKMRDLYSQLVCPSNFFSNKQFISVQPISQQQVHPKQQSDGSLKIPFKLLDQISYIGIKVINSKGKQIFYKPIQIATLWGHLSRTSSNHKLSILSIFICSILSIVICVRRNARKGYRPINDEI